MIDAEGLNTFCVSDTKPHCSSTCLENSKTVLKVECDWTTDILEYKKIMGEKTMRQRGNRSTKKKQTPGHRKGRLHGKN